VAAFYGEERQSGALQTGQTGDLVLLDADPLIDIQNTNKIRGVMAQGRWFDRATLDSLLQQIKEVASSGCHSLADISQ
jgi:adenine deaminase